MTPLLFAPLAITFWVWPVSPVAVVSGFDPPAQVWSAGPRGLDLAATTGQEVRAIGPGSVTFAHSVAGRPVISIRHGALRSTYEPVRALVSPGETVRAGQLLGWVATGGHCADRCLHLGIKSGTDYLNPLLLLSRRPAVLKPNRLRLGGAPARMTSAAALPIHGCIAGWSPSSHGPRAPAQRADPRRPPAREWRPCALNHVERASAHPQPKLGAPPWFAPRVDPFDRLARQ
ncbi:MAG: peptidoglycan DD-metalloendopeptidase family protein [Actinobacteria bacterium]|nr:peptidoglycan DD-metalloendopeptidase family protein [Actinomycetota bacterium]